MKLIQYKYRDEKKLIVSENLIKRGFDFESSQDFLTDAVEENYIDYLKVSQTDELSFREYLEMYNIKYLYLPSTYLSIEEMKVLISTYKYYYDDANNEFMKSEEILKIQEVNFLEYWNSCELEQVEITDEIINVELIETNIDNNALYGQYDIYKDKDDNLYLCWVSYYQGNLGSVEEVTADELKERFGFNYDRKER